jgi:two-component system, LytTR family, sensor kinase
MSDSNEVQDPEYQRAYRSARRQVRRLRSWYIHALIFTAVVGFFWLRYWFGPSFVDWGAYRHLPRMPLSLTLGWGFGLMIHGLVVFGRIGPFSRDWEDRQIQKFMDRGDSTGSPPSSRK